MRVNPATGGVEWKFQPVPFALDADPDWSAGAAVMSGGYGGVMDAVSRGAREAGGTAIGVTVAIPPGRTPTSALTREIRTPDLLARLRTLVYEPAGFVVLESSLGTLTEMFLAWTLLATGGRPEAPLVLLGDRWTGFLHDLHGRWSRIGRAARARARCANAGGGDRAPRVVRCL